MLNFRQSHKTDKYEFRLQCIAQTIEYTKIDHSNLINEIENFL